MKSRSRKDDAFARILRARGNPAELDIILQDECRRRVSRKLAATLALAPGFKFPTALSAEQASADIVAEFHSSLIPCGSRVVDLTAGLGIDAFHSARRADRVVALELEPVVAAALAYNAGLLGLSNVETQCSDCREWLAEAAPQSFDVAFIDPARRAEDGSRLYSLACCRPDVVTMLSDIGRVASRLLIKASPMLDISQVCRELRNVRTIYSVGTKSECKELLAEVDFQYSGLPEIKAVTVDADSRICLVNNESSVEYVDRVDVGDVIGEPWPAVMKALSAGNIGGEQLHPSTHLFRNPPADEFPGNLYRVERVEPFSSSMLKALARQGVEASVTTRNFPLSADCLRERLKARESSACRLLATTLSGGKQILVFLTPVVKKNT